MKSFNRVKGAHSGGTESAVANPELPEFGPEDMGTQILEPENDLKLRAFMAAHKIRSARPSNRLMVATAHRRGITVTGTPRGNVSLRAHGRSHWWNNGATSLNSLLARTLSAHKDVNSSVLRSRGVRVPQSAVFEASESDRAWAWATPITPLVVKPTNDSGGRGVHLCIEDRKEFDSAFDEVAARYGRVLVEEFVKGSEHRVFVVDGKLVAASRRLPAHVLGDGVSSIEELVARKNRNIIPPHRPLRLGSKELARLASNALEPLSIVGEGVVVQLRGTSNLSTGADAIDATDELSASEVQYFESAAKCWPSLRSAGFDALLPRTAGDDGPVIIEINHAAGTGGHHFPRSGVPRDVIGAVLDAMFPESRVDT